MRLRAVSLDFGNTLYPFRRAETESSIRYLHAFLQERLGKPLEYAPLVSLYREIRDHQFAENRPTLRENDFTARIRHIIEAFSTSPVDSQIVRDAADVYADGFVAVVCLPKGVKELVGMLAETYQVAVLSNFIRTDCIRRPLERDGLLPHLKTVVVSTDIGYIKPHPAVFAELAKNLDIPPEEIVHVGDDWDADILGATAFGMNAIYTTEWRDEPDPYYGHGEIAPLFEIARLADLTVRLQEWERR